MSWGDSAYSRPNEIDGSTTNAPAPFASNGGTLVSVQTATAAGAAGPIGSVRVGTNATNFSVVTPDKINHVLRGRRNEQRQSSRRNWVAQPPISARGWTPSRSRPIRSSGSSQNRGAINSNVTSDRQIGNIEFGGDVVGTTILSGYNQSLASAVGNPKHPDHPESRRGRPDQGEYRWKRDQLGLRLLGSRRFRRVRLVRRLEVAARDDQRPHSGFDQQLGGDNPQSPTAAFFAQSLKLTKGPVVPPAIPEAPYSGPLTPASLPGIPAPLRLRPYPTLLVPPVARPRSKQRQGKELRRRPHLTMQGAVDLWPRWVSGRVSCA